jgi:hypothetical protein
MEPARLPGDGAPKTRQQWLQDLAQAAWRQGQDALAAGDVARGRRCDVARIDSWVIHKVGDRRFRPSATVLR